MHELSIAMEVLNIVNREAAAHQASEVSAVHLKIGVLAGVDTDSLVFSFDAVKGERPLTAGARLVVERVPVRIGCIPCGEEYEAGDLSMVCPSCGGVETTLLEGAELEIGGIDIEQKGE